MKVGFIGLGRMGAAWRRIWSGPATTSPSSTARPRRASAGRAGGARRRQGGRRLPGRCRHHHAGRRRGRRERRVRRSAASSPTCRGRSTSPRARSASPCRERLAAAHAEAGQRFVAAPVFGRPEAAAAAKLFVVAARRRRRRAARLCSRRSARRRSRRRDAKAANLVKLSGNFLIASVIEVARRGHGAGRQGRRRPAAISRAPDLHAVRRAGLQDLWRADRRRRSSSRPASPRRSARRTSA